MAKPQNEAGKSVKERNAHIHHTMAMPEVSIILPVYNGAPHLAKAIDSILTQSFADFELIIVNDGSVDGSEQIISASKDPRIVYIANEVNSGLIFTLNRGIDRATGKYIARMDADDICLKDRLAVQKKWLDENAGTSMVACTVQFIDENDMVTGNWPTDLDTVSAASIRKKLPHQNCIAHPTVMIRSEILKAYRYKAYQKNIEDYDLWLRLEADGKKIEKVSQALLLYRVHAQSVTSTYLKTGNSFLKHFHCKRKYLYHRIGEGKFNFFDARVFAHMLADLLMSQLKNLKRRIVR
jgi:glycosyltransferase involved in cell wall biosynthesis